MSEKQHNLLTRQINKHLKNQPSASGKIDAFLQAVNDTYHSADQERLLIERSMDISSQELMDRNAEISAIFKAFPDVFVRINQEGEILDFKFSNTYDLPFIIGNPVGRLVYDFPIKNINKIFPQVVDKIKKTEKLVTLEHTITLNQNKYHFELRFQRLPKDDIVVIIRNITDRKIAEEQLRHDALHDKLTGLPNRSLFMDRLVKLIQRANRNKDYRFSILFIDFDRFKIVNDSLGHLVGDQLLIEISKRLSNTLRSVDTVARLGGDEFTILLDDINNKEGAIIAADRIQKTIATPFNLNGNEVFMSSSIGITLNNITKETQKPEDYLRDADIAMYHAKNNGRARYEIFNTKMHLKAVATLTLESDLRRAIDNNELELHYQPVFSLKEKKPTSVEALLRWKHPKQGYIPPIEFISLAEETGLIMAIGEWVLHTASHQCKEWQKQGLANIRIAINISAVQFAHQNLPKIIKHITDKYNIEASMIEIEITESVAMRDINYSIRVLKELKDLGMCIAVDDFGVGYSSLSSLMNFPIDYLKVDRSFVKDIPLNENSITLTSAIIALGHKLNLTIIAEGVETDDQLDFLTENKCDKG
ncbi:MAG: diguanylate cyclase (GGDEF)-like protein, partial [Candidatus Omnitrophota bacterium]